MTSISAEAETTNNGQTIEVLIPREDIDVRLNELAAEISANEAENLLVIAVLKGSFIFAADLIRALHTVGLKPEVDFMTLSSYRKSTVSSGAVDILRDCEVEVSGRSVLLVDDVLDSGRTLAFAKDLLTARGASKISTCVLLEKQKHRAVELEADYSAFPCPETFVIGYGMDLAHRYRELPFVGRLVMDDEA
ncbi:MAG: hypoxanthine phosphoribosyltransferase [Pseudomonadota bacterium]